MTTAGSLSGMSRRKRKGAMMAHCSSATSGFAVFRTWLKSARFGPIDTSYQDMNQNPGILIG